VPPRISLSLPRPAPPPVADGVPCKPERHPPDVSDARGLLLEKRVSALGGKDHEELLVAEVLEARLPQLSAAGPRRFRDPDAVLRDELPVDRPGVLAGRDSP